MDEVLQKAFPTVLAPRFQPFAPLDVTGDRFVLSRTRVLFEVCRPWLYAVKAISNSLMRSTPYGDGPEETVKLRCGPIPRVLLEEFRQQAKNAFPLETAAWIVWNDKTGHFGLKSLVELSSTADRVAFERPVLPLGNHLVIDIHSHGSEAAFFSPTDDEDDKDQLCISVVLGNVDRDIPSMVARLCMLGVFSPVKVI